MLFKKTARFSQLNKTGLSNDHFTFHINELVKSGLVQKLPGRGYTLTTLGKEFANRFDTENKSVERQAKIAALIVCTKKENGEIKYLLQQRLKQPYFGFYGFIGGKIRWGETIYEAAKRELQEETGLLGKIKLAGLEHKIDYSQTNELLEDKFFYVFQVEKTRGKLIEKFNGGKNCWFTKKEIFSLENLFGDVDKIIKMVNRKSLLFSELKYKVKKY